MVFTPFSGCHGELQLENICPLKLRDCHRKLSIYRWSSIINSDHQHTEHNSRQKANNRQKTPRSISTLRTPTEFNPAIPRLHMSNGFKWITGSYSIPSPESADLPIKPPISSLGSNSQSGVSRQVGSLAMEGVGERGVSQSKQERESR